MNFSILAIITRVIIILINLMINTPQTLKPSLIIKRQFECGFSHFISIRPSFSNQFFIVGILFLIFDLEISILLPCFKSENRSYILILLVSLIFIFLTFFFLIE